MAFTWAVPSATASNRPEASIVPTDVLLHDQVISAVIGLPYWSRGEAVKVWFSVGSSVFDSGETVIEVRTAGASVILKLKIPPLSISS